MIPRYSDLPVFHPGHSRFIWLAKPYMNGTPNIPANRVWLAGLFLLHDPGTSPTWSPLRPECPTESTQTEIHFSFSHFWATGKWQRLRISHLVKHKLLSLDLCPSPMPSTQRLRILATDVNRDLGNNNAFHLSYSYHVSFALYVLHIFNIFCMYSYPACDKLTK